MNEIFAHIFDAVSSFYYRTLNTISYNTTQHKALAYTATQNPRPITCIILDGAFPILSLYCEILVETPVSTNGLSSSEQKHHNSFLAKHMGNQSQFYWSFKCLLYKQSRYHTAYF